MVDINLFYGISAGMENPKLLVIEIVASHLKLWKQQPLNVFMAELFCILQIPLAEVLAGQVFLIIIVAL